MVKANFMQRVGVAFFYDGEGIVDEYMFYLVAKMSEFTERMIFISNGPIQDKYQRKIKEHGWELIIRDNIGFDVWAYKTAIEHIGYDNLANYDELILFNHTFYGPIYPFKEMFDTIDNRKCDFWGITAHKEMIPNPFTEEGILPRHINSHFIAVRKPMLTSDSFKDYWVNMPMIKSYVDSVLTHESKFTGHFEDLGFSSSVYDDDTKYDSKYSAVINVDESLENRCPILKRRIFFHDSIFIEANAIDLPRALRIMRATSDYDEKLIWPNIVRTADLRTLNTNADLTSVLPDKRIKSGKHRTIKNIAVCAHIYYVEMVDELMELASNITIPFDFIATTDTIEKKIEIEKIVSKYKCVKNINVILLEVNRGRDMSALFISCRDLFLDDRYDLVCRLHTKKSPQVESSRSNIFKRHLYDNLLHSSGYVENVIDMFEAKPWVGLAVPPAVHISYHTLGMAWFANKPKAIEIAKELDLKVKFDEATPVAAYGTMFWFRPKALRKLFDHKWQWDEFNPEPHHVDGGLAHVLERLISYTAQDAGYTTEQIMSETSASFNYAMLEFKFQKIAQYLPFNTTWQVHMCKLWSETGHYLPPKDISDRREGFSFKAAWYEDESIAKKSSAEFTASLVNEYKELSNSWHKYYVNAVINDDIKQNGGTLSSYKSIISEFMQSVGSINWKNSYKDLEKAIEDYCVIGALNGDDIFPLFDSNYYLSNNIDVAKSGFNPLAHFLIHGYKEMRNPHPLFDLQYYKSKCPNAFIDEQNPLAYFLKNSENDMISPHPLFDMALYCGLYPDVKQSGLNPLVHYINNGSNELRVPHVMFDPNHYISGLGSKLPENINLLSHYLLIGNKEGIDPHALFDIKYYKSQLDNDNIEYNEPLTYFVTKWNETYISPHPLFDIKDYVREYSYSGNINPIEHYIQYGANLGFNPNACFDSKFYLEKYPEIKATGINPLVHYVKYGAGELREPIPEFDSQFYIKNFKGKASDGKFIPFVHYFKKGWKEMLDTNSDFSIQDFIKEHQIIIAKGYNPLAFYRKNLKNIAEK